MTVPEARERARKVLESHDFDYATNALAEDVLALADDNERLQSELKKLLRNPPGWPRADMEHALANAYERAVAEATTLRQALTTITLTARGHDCYGHCHRMKQIALDALAGALCETPECPCGDPTLCGTVDPDDLRAEAATLREALRNIAHASDPEHARELAELALARSPAQEPA